MWDISVGQRVRRQAELGSTGMCVNKFQPSPDTVFKTKVLHPPPHLVVIHLTPCQHRRSPPGRRGQMLDPLPGGRPPSWHCRGGKRSRRRSRPSAASAWGSSSCGPHAGRWCTCRLQWHSSRSLWSWWQSSGNKLTRRKKNTQVMLFANYVVRYRNIKGNSLTTS